MTGPATTRLLLVSPPRPFGRRHGDAFSCQTNAAFQLTWAQEGFRVEDMVWHWGLDLIASNLKTSTTVLHYPTRAEFRRELRLGYTHIGFTVNPPTWHKVKPLMEDARRLAPGATLIIGGYGARMPENEFSGLADVVCREEGVSFMRLLLGEPDAPLVHPAISIPRSIFGIPTGERTGIIFNALGCPNGCDFCMTSHFYDRRKIYFLPSATQVVKTMLDMQDRDPRITSFAIFDEDFLLDEGRGREFLAAVEAAGRYLDIMVFSSVRSLSQFSPLELTRMGIARVWVGYESPKAGYAKQEGKPFAQLCAELRGAGISVMSSSIVGYDHQTEAIVRSEFEALLATRPTAVQVMLLSPCFGTSAWTRMENEGRLIHGLQKDWAAQDGYTQLFRHPHMESDRMEALVKELYHLDFQRLGPTMFRFFDVMLAGYLYHRDHPHALLRMRAEVFRARLQRTLALFPLGIAFAPNANVRSELSALRQRIAKEAGGNPVRITIGSLLLLLPFFWASLRHRLGGCTQPRRMRACYGDLCP